MTDANLDCCPVCDRAVRAMAEVETDIGVSLAVSCSACGKLLLPPEAWTAAQSAPMMAKVNLAAAVQAARSEGRRAPLRLSARHFEDPTGLGV